MKEDEDIDKLFKDNLEEVNISDIPQAYLDDINKRLNSLSAKDNSGFHFRFLWVIPLLTVAGFITYYLFSTTPSSLKNENSTIGKTINEEKNNTPSHASNYTTNKKSIDEVTTIIEKHPPLLNLSEHTNSNRTEEITNANKSIVNNKRAYYPPAKDKKEKGIDKQKLFTTPNVSNENNKTIRKQNLAIKNTPENKTLFRNTSHKKTRSNTITFPPTLQNKIVYTNADSTDVLANASNKIKSSFKNKKNKKYKNNFASRSLKKNATKTNSTNLNSLKTGTTELPNVSEKADTVANKTKNELVENDIKDSVTNLQPLLLTEKTADSLQTIALDSISKTEKDSLKEETVVHSKSEKDSVKDNPAIGAFSINILAGGLQVNSTFNSQNTDYNNKRKNEEHSFVAIDATLLINYSKNKFVYSAGINFSQWGEKINYSATTSLVNYITNYDTTYTTQQTDNTHFVVNPAVKSVYGSKEIKNTTVTTHNGINRYSYLSIPFLLGYAFEKNKFSITPKIGGTLGIPMQSKGYYVNDNLQELIQEKAVSWLFNLQGEMNLKYSYFIISPFYRRSMSYVIHSDNTTNNYSGFGVRLGICIPL